MKTIALLVVFGSAPLVGALLAGAFVYRRGARRFLSGRAW